MKKGYKINISNPKYCALTSDTEEGVQYGEVKSLGEAMEVQVTPSVASGKLYGDGEAVDSASRLTGLTLSLQTTKVSSEARVDIYNLEVKNGVIVTKTGTTPKDIAIGYEVEQSNGKSQYVWLLKGSPKPMNDSIQQSTDNINYSTDKMDVDFVRRNYDKSLKYDAEEGELGFSEAQAAAWFKNGPSNPVAQTTQTTQTGS